MKRVMLLLGVAGLLVGCGPRKTSKTTTEEPRVLTRTAEATAAEVVLSEVFTSEIEPYRENDITPAASGVHIARIWADVGDVVQQGDVLVTLDPTQYNQQLVQLRTVENDYNRLLPVYEAGGISAQQIDQARAQLDVQREIVNNLHRNIEFRSPISGVVTARNAEAGDLLTGQPVLHVMQINPLKVMVNISEQFFPQVKVGMPVKLEVDIFPDMEFTGTVSLIYPALDAATRTFRVEVRVPNDRNTLRPGMYARTIFDMGTRQGVLVPDVAVQKQVGSAERYLYVVRGDSVAERRTVEVGRQVGDRVDILSGVAAGEQVAITALSKLTDGARVEVLHE